MAFDSSPSALGSGAGGIFGLAGGIYSAIQGAGISKQETQVQQAEIGTQVQMDVQRRQAMELSAQRQQLQNVRNMQMARSMALSTSANQGAQFGSGLGGAYGSISGQAGNNNLGISQNLQIGENMFNLEGQLSQEKIQMAGLQGDAATNSALGGMFSSVGKMGGTFGNLLGMIPFG